MTNKMLRLSPFTRSNRQRHRQQAPYFVPQDDESRVVTVKTVDSFAAENAFVYHVSISLGALAEPETFDNVFQRSSKPIALMQHDPRGHAQE